MTNEIIFILHIGILIAATLIAFRIGKKGLISLASLQIVLSNLFITKQIYLFGLQVTSTDAYTIGSLLCLNLYSELTSKKEAAKLANINIFILLFFVIMALFQLAYHPTVEDTVHSSFVQILSIAPRIFLASIFTYILSQRLDLFLFSRFRKHLPLSLSMIASLSLSQAFDTFVFSFLGLYGIVHSIVSIIIFSYVIKLLSILLLSSITIFIKKRALTSEI